MPACLSLSQLNCFSHQLRRPADRSPVPSRSTVNVSTINIWEDPDHIRQVKKIVKDYDKTKSIARNLYDASVKKDGFRTDKKLTLENMAFDFDVHKLDPGGNELNVHSHEECVKFPENITLEACSLRFGKMQFCRGTVRAMGKDAELFLAGKEAIGIADHPSSTVRVVADKAVGFANNGTAYASVAGATAVALGKNAHAFAVSTGAIAIAKKGWAHSECEGALAAAVCSDSHAKASISDAVALAIDSGKAIAREGGLAFALTSPQGNEEKSTAHADTGGRALAEVENTLAVYYKMVTLVRQAKQTNFVDSSGKSSEYRPTTTTQNDAAVRLKEIALEEMKGVLNSLIVFMPRHADEGLSDIKEACNALHLLWATRPATKIAQPFQGENMKSMQGKLQQGYSSSGVSVSDEAAVPLVNASGGCQYKVTMSAELKLGIEKNGLTQNVKSSGVQQGLESKDCMKKDCVKIDPSPLVVFPANGLQGSNVIHNVRKVDRQEQLQQNDTQHEKNGHNHNQFSLDFFRDNSSSEAIMPENASGAVDTEDEGQTIEDEKASFVYHDRENSLVAAYDQLHSQPLKKDPCGIIMGIQALKLKQKRNIHNSMVIEDSPIVICPIEQQLTQQSNVQNAGLSRSGADYRLKLLSNNLKEPVKKMGEQIPTPLETTV